MRKLEVYNKGLEFIAWSGKCYIGKGLKVTALEHWRRAAESIVDNIANGNSRHARTDRNRYFNIALGSTLECAACIDICNIREVLNKQDALQGKRMLKPIAEMIVGLRKAESDFIREELEEWPTQNERLFSHERLEVYQVGLDLIRWYHKYNAQEQLGEYESRLDKNTTAVVLNIAEGNGRFSVKDQARFLDIAHSSIVGVTTVLDIMVAREMVDSGKLNEGYKITRQIVAMLIGLKRKLVG